MRDVEPASSSDGGSEPIARIAFTRSRIGPKRRRRLILEVGAVLSIAWLPNLINAAIGLIRDGAHRYTPTAWHLYYVLQGGALTAIPVLYVMHRSKDDWARFGIVRPRLLRDVGLGLALLVANIIWSRFWGKIMGPTLGLVPVDYPNTRPTTAALALLVPAELANAFSEELAMRGYLIARLETLLGGKEGAVVFSSLAFASYHIYMGPDAFIRIFMVGLLYGIVFSVTRRLWPVVLAHAAIDVLLDIRAWL